MADEMACHFVGSEKIVKLDHLEEVKVVTRFP